MVRSVLNLVFFIFLIFGCDLLSFFQGTGIGKCPKNKLFREYISIELQVLTFYYFSSVLIL